MIVVLAQGINDLVGRPFRNKRMLAAYLSRRGGMLKLAASLCRWGGVFKHFHHLDTHWTCANHGVPSDRILRCHLVEESPRILPNSHILHTCQASYCPRRHLNPMHIEWSDHEPTCPLQVQQHWHMYSAIPQNGHTPSCCIYWNSFSAFCPHISHTCQTSYSP